MKTLFLFFILFGLANPSQASDRPLDWHAGTVVLASGVAWYGLLHYDRTTEVVELRTEVVTKAFSVYQVQSFRFEDEAFGMLREFVPGDLPATNAYPSKAFFEVVLKGPVSLLRRLNTPWELAHVEARLQPNPIPTVFDHQRDFTYYVVQQGTVQKLTRFRKAFLPGLRRTYGGQLHQWVKERRLNLSTLAGQIQLINYCNFLAGGSSQAEWLVPTLVPVAGPALLPGK